MKDKKYWIDSKSNVDKLVYAICIICVSLFLIDFFYEKHPQVYVEQLFGFYCLYGFIICCGIVFGGIALRKLVARQEKFYDK